MQRTVFEVDRSGNGWVLRHKETGVETAFETREAAIEAGRAAMKANAPSLLRIRKVKAGG